MGGGGSRTQNTVSKPWKGQQPFLSDLFRQAKSQFQQGGPEYYPDSTVIPFSPQTELGLDLTTGRALGGDPVQNQFGGYLAQQLGQQNIDPRLIAQGSMQAASGMIPAQQLLGASGLTGQQAAAGITPAQQLLQSGAAAGQQAATGIAPAQQLLQSGAKGMDYDTALSMAGLPGGDLAGGVGLPDVASNQLSTTAGGGFLGSNPYLDQVYDTAADAVTERFSEDILPGINASFGAAGRTGSGAQALMQGRAAGDVAEQLRGLAGDIYAPAYESERERQITTASQLGQLGQQADIANLQADLQRRDLASDLFTGGLDRKLAAGGQLGQLGLGGLSSQLSAGGQLGDIGLGGLSSQLSAGSQLGQLGLGGLGTAQGLYGDIAQNQFRAGSLAPTYRDMQYGDLDRLLGVGRTVETQAQDLLNADIDRWNYQQNLPQQNLQNYANIIYGLPGGYGSTRTSGGGGSRLSGALGGAATGASIAGPWGALGGAVLGGLL